MVKCVFCGREESPHKGVHLLKNDGSVNFYCSSKCRKNAIKLGRDRRKIKWTAAYKENLVKANAKEAKKKEAIKEAAKSESKKEEKSSDKKK